MFRWYALIVLTAWMLAASAVEPARQQVLCLHSYHPAEWTDAIMRGYRGILGGRGNLDLAVEYMDTKRCEDAAYLDLLAEAYRRKYAGTRFAGILTSDDHAYAFALKWRAQLFADAPVVFCGVNRWKDVVAARPPGVTGVAEQAEWAQTLAVARAARPLARTLHVICDDTETARKNLAELRSALATQPDLSLAVPDGLDLRQLTAHLASLPPGDLALFIAYWREPGGRAVSPEELAPALRASAAPVFGRSEWAVGLGQAGGSCVSGERQGRAAATLLAAVLDGAPADDLPLVTDSPNILLFDWNELDHHGIDPAILPPGSEIINQPDALLRIPRPVAALILACLILLAGLVATLLVLMRQRRKAAAASLAAAANLKTILHSMGDGVIATDGSGRVTALNPVAERLTGWEEAAAAGRPIEEIFRLTTATDRQALEVPARTALRTGMTQHLANHALLTDRSGGEYHIADSGAPMRDAAGGIVGAVLVFRDVSERHQLEERLRRAQTMEALGRMAGGIAHDFNNLLTAILGGVQLIRLRCAGTGDCRSLTNQVEDAVNRATELTAKLLALARNKPTSASAVDLHVCLTTAASLLKHAVGGSITITLETQASKPWIACDRVTIENAVLNLGLNARDAMPGVGSLFILTTDLDQPPPGAADQPHGWLRLTVRDTGSGMDAATQARVFEPFFTTKPSGKGTGLGLAMVYAAVTSLGGQARLESAPGAGTTVILDLPRCAPPAAPSEPTAVPGAPRSTCVLVVDDDAVAREVSKVALEAVGHIVLTAGDGREGAELFAREQARIQLVVLDMIMPEQDGRACLAAIRALSPRMPAVLVSGYIGDPTAADDFDVVISKPYRLTELQQAVAGLLALPSR